jgi:hypothetical protein
MTNKLIIPAILSSYRPRVDGSWSISFSTNILKKEEKQVIDEMFQKVCCIMIKDSDITNEEIDVFDTIEMGGVNNKKSKSQLQREAIYLLWVKEGKKGSDKEYYDNYMDRIRQHLLDKLDT